MAVLLGLTALATSLAPRPTVTPGQESATPPRRPVPHPPAASPVIEEDDRRGRWRRAPRAYVCARVTSVRLAVRSDAPGRRRARGLLGKLEPVGPGSPARFEFLAERAGEHPIMLLDADRQVGLIDIRARADG